MSNDLAELSRLPSSRNFPRSAIRVVLLASVAAMTACGGGGGGGGGVTPDAVTSIEPNDTGITSCDDGTPATVSCDAVGNEYANQDGKFGRDANSNTNSDSDGVKGFSFSKLDASGSPLGDQSTVWTDGAWACVRDNVTGYVWEVKSDAGRDDTFTWYDSASGVGVQDGGSCDSAGSCDTEAYVTALNATNWCGRNDWRLPERDALISLVHYGKTSGATIDLSYFPNTQSGEYWTSHSGGQTPGARRATVNFGSGLVSSLAYSGSGNTAHVRVVAGNL